MINILFFAGKWFLFSFSQRLSPHKSPTRSAVFLWVMSHIIRCDVYSQIYIWIGNEVFLFFFRLPFIFIHPSILYRWQRRRRQYRRTTRFSVASSAAAIVARATHPTFGGKSLLEITNFFLQKIKGGWRFFCYRCSFSSSSSSSTLARIRNKKQEKEEGRKCV
jgi:hypothetical protein